MTYSERMKRHPLIICLTDNTWLYQGMVALLSERPVIRLRYEDTIGCKIVLRESRNCILLTDMSVFLHGEWTVFNLTLAQKPDTKVIWLKRPDSGAIFPAGREGDLVIEQKQSPGEFYRQLSGNVSGLEQKRTDKAVEPFVLTGKEKSLLPYFILDLDMKLIAKWSAISIKTLYHHRNKILKKSGFPRVDMMQFAFRKNIHLIR